MTHALSDDQVAGELKKMVAFIKQEAVEKAREISIKADEEFEIEKSKLVRSETAAIDATYARKFKQAELSQQIARSTAANKTRLRVLAAQQEMLTDIFERTRGRLAEISNDADRYAELVKNLILEGLYALSEPTLQIRIREKDREVAEKAKQLAADAYKEKMGKEITVTLDEKNMLPESCHGGVFIVGTGGKITIDNTLEQRLRVIETDALPAVRASVFGSNPNRKFRD